MKLYKITYHQYEHPESLYTFEYPYFVEASSILEASSKVSNLHPDLLQVVNSLELVSDSPVVR